MENTRKARALHRLTGALAVALAVIVMLICWVFVTQQQAGAVTGGKYDIKIVVYDSNDGCNGDKTLKVTYKYKTNHGHGNESSEITLFDKSDQSFSDSSGESNGKSLYIENLDGFPSYVYCYIKQENYFSGGDWALKVYAKPAGSGSYNTQAAYMNIGGITSGGSKSNSTTDFSLPYAKDVHVDNIDSTISSTGAIQLDGSNSTTRGWKFYCTDQYGVRLGTDPTDVTFEGSENSTGLSYSGETADTYTKVFCTVDPEAHLTGQGKNRQTATLTVKYSIDTDHEAKTQKSFTVTDEWFKVRFYDRAGNLRKGTSSATTPALSPTYTTFNGAANKNDGYQYAYYGDTIYPPFDYTGTDTAETRFNPYAYYTDEHDHSLPTSEETIEGKKNCIVCKDKASKHYIWKGWSQLLDANDALDESVRSINTDDSYAGPRTGAIDKKYATAHVTTSYQECFTGVSHTPSNEKRATNKFSQETCTQDAVWHKVCSDTVCSYMYTFKKEGKLGSEDYLWVETGTMKHHDWSHTPTGAGTIYCSGTPTATAKAKSCTEDGSYGYFLCKRCHKYFDYSKTDDTTNDYWKSKFDGQELVNQTEAEVSSAAIIPRTGHNYVFEGWTWAEDHLSATGKIHCSNSNCCDADNHHAFTIRQSGNPTCDNEDGTTYVNMDGEGNYPHVLYTYTAPTCTKKGAKVYEIPANTVTVTVEDPDSNGLDSAHMATLTVKEQKFTDRLDALGHNFSESADRIVPYGGESKTEQGVTVTVYSGHQYKCTRYDDCKKMGVVKDGVQKADDYIRHGETTETTSTATCQRFAVCSDCAERFGKLTAHDFSEDSARIANTDADDESKDLNDFSGHYYKCSYGCGKNGVMLDGVARTGATNLHNFDTNGDGEITKDDGDLVRPASCTVKGRRCYTCVDCGFKHYTESDSSRDDDLKATGHNYEGQIVTVTPFQTDGQYNRTITASVTCKNEYCGKYDKDGNLNPYPEKNVVAEIATVSVSDAGHKATCTETGLNIRTAAFTKTEFENTVESDGVTSFNRTRTDNSEVLPALGHDWTVTVEWSDKHAKCTGTAVCSRNSEHNVIQEATVNETVINSASCTETGEAKYSASFNDYYDTFGSNKTFQTYYNEHNMDETAVLDALGHDWKASTYKWSPTTGNQNTVFTSVNASHLCLRCSILEEQTVTPVPKTIPATCETDGEKLWTATFSKKGFDEQTKSFTLERSGHAYDYDNATYSWGRKITGEEGVSTRKCTARVVCGNDKSHVHTEEVTCTGEVKQELSCDTDEIIEYNALFSDLDFQPQTRTDTRTALGHNWEDPHVDWADDFSSVTGTIHCKNDTNHTHDTNLTLELSKGEIEQKVKTKATCTSAGLIVYKAHFPSQFGMQTTSQAVPKLDHILSEETYGQRNTCSAPGLKDYKICVGDAQQEGCGGKFVEEPAGSGNWVEAVSVILYPSSEHNDINGDPYPPSTAAPVAATCTEAGTKEVTYCPGCKLIFSIDGEEIPSENNYRYGTDKAQYSTAIDPNNHVLAHREFVAQEAPTCARDGNIAYSQCQDCQKYLNDEGNEITAEETVLPASGHNWDFAHAATEWTDDYGECKRTAVCLNDNAHKLIETATAENGQIEKISVPGQEATCETAGKCTYRVSFENEGFNFETQVLDDPAFGHDWDKLNAVYAWNANHSACTATLVCKNDETHILSDPATEITSSTRVPVSCSVDGKVDYTATFATANTSTATETVTAFGHDWDYTGEEHAVEYEWSPDGTRCTAKVRCKTDASHINEIFVDAEYVTIIEASCTEKGRAMYLAQFKHGIANAEGEAFDVEKLSHRAERITAVMASCTESGNRAYYYCTRCSNMYWDAACTELIADSNAVILPMQPHATEGNYHAAFSPTCTANGSKAYWSCSICGGLFKDKNGTQPTTEENEVVAAAGHSWVRIAATPATCTKPGNSDYLYCPRCKLTEGYSSIAALGHGDYVYDHVHSSVSADGSVRWDIYNCGRNCGAYYANMTVTLRDKNGKQVPNANVTITSNGNTVAVGVTDKYGEFSPTNNFAPGSYKINVTYDDGKNRFSSTSTITLSTSPDNEAVVTGAQVGKTGFSVDTVNNNTNNNNNNNSGNEPAAGNACRYCGQVHSGPFGWLIQIFHNLFAMFG